MTRRIQLEVRLAMRHGQRLGSLRHLRHNGLNSLVPERGPESRILALLAVRRLEHGTRVDDVAAIAVQQRHGPL